MCSAIVALKMVKVWEGIPVLTIPVVTTIIAGTTTNVVMKNITTVTTSIAEMMAVIMTIINITTIPILAKMTVSAMSSTSKTI